MAYADQSASVAARAGRRLTLLGRGVSRRDLVVFLLATGAILLLRAPSFFEPPWHTDEGIFAAVALRVLHGGRLYADAWESKPPLFLYLYVAVFRLFGAGVLQLRLAATASALATQWALYGVGCRLTIRRRALAASLLAGVLLGVPFWEGTLALTETFAVLPTCLGVLCVLQASRRADGQLGGVGGDTWWLIGAGVLFGVAFLLRQTAVVAGGACVLWLFFARRAWLRPTLLIALGSAACVLPLLAVFIATSGFAWLYDANIGFFFQYVPSGQEIPFAYRFVILAPVVCALGVLTWYRQRHEAPAWSLPALWLVLMLAAALLTGRPYSHYFLQTFPPLALLVVLLLPSRLALPRQSARLLPGLALAASLALLWLTVVMPEFGGNPFAMRYTQKTGYYVNFLDWATGRRDRASYDAFFDRRVALTDELDAELRRLHAEGASAYIWGEYPWVYALSDLNPADRYMTSFYDLLIPYLDVGFGQRLTAADPRYIIVTADARTRLNDTSFIVGQRYAIATLALDDLLSRRYERVATIDKAEVYERVPERPALPPSVAHLDQGYDYAEP